jgi:hypothetical protein
MRCTWRRCATVYLAWCLAAGPYAAAGQSAGQDIQRRALIAALESLIATGEPRHITHDEGQWLQLAIDDAIARGDREIEMLAIRAASPLTASITRPVSSARDLPAISFDASAVLRVKRAIPYTARVFASIDGGEFVAVRALRSGSGEGGRVDTVLSDAAARPGFHVVRLRAELTFGTGADGAPSWTESRTLQPLVYAVYDPVADSGAAIRALVYGPASTPVRELDPLLGDEPFAAWLSGVLSARRGDRDSGPDWLSQYCDERTGEAGTKSAPTAICAVVYFQSRGEIGQIWFRTADIREAAHGIEWIPAAPPRFEGLVVLQSAPESQRLSSLPSLLDTAAPSRPVGDISVLPGDIVVTPIALQPGELADVAITVRNIGAGDLHKAVVNVAWGADPTVRGSSRQFVVDVPAQGSAELKLQVLFPNGYGFVLAHAMQVSEHSPHESFTPDPTPHNACAARIVNARLAPARYTESLLIEAAGGCSVK